MSKLTTTGESPDAATRPRADAPAGTAEPRFRVTNYAMLLKPRVMSLVVFTAASGSTAGSWGSITFNDTSQPAVLDTDGNYTQGCVLEHCLVQYAGISGSAAQVVVLNSGPFLNHCRIVDGGTLGIYSTGASSNFRIQHSTIARNSSGGLQILDSKGVRLSYLQVHDTGSDGISINGDNNESYEFKIQNCQVHDNQGKGIFNGGYQAGEITDNVVKNNNQDGISVYLLSGNAANNLVSSNCSRVPD